MSTTIDSKVVEMRFDNGQFEQGVSQSISSLDKLKASLKIDGNTTAETLNVVVQGFDALGSVLNRVRENITDSVWATVIKTIKYLSVDQIAEGWSKYGTLMDSVQTIMSATRQDWEDQGEQMEYVTGQIKKLNWYTDETSWNLVDMTSNIGKFVAAGVDIETATTAMEGIGSWAGQSGAKVDQMSRAMYNLSQAMALGAVRVQDWMSIENANMATKEFKEVAIQTALEMGTLSYNADGAVVAFDKFGHEVEVTAETFRSTLSANWFSGDVLTATLKKYGDFADGLHKTVQETGATATELLGYIDDYKEAMANGEDMTTWVQELAAEENITNVKALAEGLEYLSSDYNELGRSAFKASQECKTFKDVQLAMQDAVSSAWMGIFEAIVGNYLESKELWSSIAEELYEVFVDYLNEIRRALETWGEVFGGRETLLEALWNFWYNIKDVIMSIKEGFERVFPTDKLASKLLYFVQDLKALSEKFRFIDFPWYSDVENIKDAAESIGHALSRLWEAIKVIAKSIGAAWEQIFPSNETNALTLTLAVKYLAEWIEKLSEAFIMNRERSEMLQRTFAGLFAIADILKELIIAIAEVIFDATGSTEGFADGILGVTATIGDYLVAFRDWIKENDVFRVAIATVIGFIQSIPEKLNKVCQDLFNMGLDEVWEKIKSAALSAWEAIKNFFINLPTYAENVSQALFGMSLDEVWNKIKEAASSAWDKIKEFFEWVRSNLGKMFQKSDEGGEGFSETLETTGQSVQSFSDKLSEWFENVKKFWELASPYFEQIGQGIKESFDFSSIDFEGLGKSMIGGGFLTLCLVAAKYIATFLGALNKIVKDGDKIGKSIKGMFDSISGAFKSLSKRISADIMKTIATAILEIAAAIFILSILDTEKMADSAMVIGAFMAGLALMLYEFDNLNVDKKKFKAIKQALEVMMLAIAEITAAIVIISREDIDGCKAAAVMIGALLLEISVIIAYFGKMDDIDEGQMLKAAAAMTIMGVAMIEIAAALRIVAEMPMEGMLVGAIALSGVLTVMVIALTALSEAEGNIVKAAAVSVLMGIAMLELSISLAILANSDPMSLVAGALALSAVLTVMVVALTALGEAEGNLAKGAAASILMGVALLEISVALAILGLVDPASLLAGTVALSAILLALTLVLVGLGESEGNILKGAAALTLASAGLLLIAGALAIVASVVEGGHMWETLGLLAAALALVLIAAIPAEYLSVGLVALGAAIALIGAGALMAGAGLLLFAEAVERLVAAGPGAIENMVDGISKFFSAIPDIAANVVHAITNFITEFVKMRDTFVEGIVTFITVICDSIIQAVPKIMETIGTIVVGILDLLITLIPKFMEFLGVLLVAICQFIVDYTPTMVDTLIFFTKETLRGLAAITSDITQTAIDILLDVLHKIEENIAEVTALLIEIAIDTIIGTIDGIAAKLDDIVDCIWNFIISLVDAISNGLEEHAKPLKEAIDRLMINIWNAIKEFFGVHSPSTKFKELGDNLIQGLINGIDEMVKAAKDAITGLADKVLTSICDFFGVDKPTNASELGKLGVDIINQLRDGINNMIGKVKDKIREVADAVITKFCEILGIDKPKDKQEFLQFGIKVLQQLNAGIYGMIGKVKDMIRQVAQGAIDKFNEFWENFKNVGHYLIEGFKNGIKNAAYLVTSAVRNVGQDAVNAVKGVLGINSPSTVFAEIGQYADEGLAQGLYRYASLVEDAGEDVAFNAIDSVSDAIANIYDMVNDEMDGDPVIKPVLDLSDVMAGASAINDMLTTNRSVNLAATTSSAFNGRVSEQVNMTSAFEDLRNTLSGISLGGGTSNNNVFYITGDDPRAIAEEVSRILQEDVDKEGRAWA